MKHAILPTTKALWLGILLFITTAPTCAQGTMKVHIIDVGQGSATLLEFSCGVVLVDVGGEESDLFSSRAEIYDYLTQFFDNRPDLNKTIDLLILSHPHIDHTRSVKTIDTAFVIKNVITNGEESGSGKWGQIHIHKVIADAEGTPDPSDDIGYWEATTSDIPVTGITNTTIDPINCDDGDPEIKLLWGRINSISDLGDDSFGHSHLENANNHSVAVKVTLGGSSILLPGDLEEEAIEALLEKYEGTDMLDVGVYQVGHHGSYNGTTSELLEATTPEMAVISCGNSTRQAMWTAWAYGHPNLSVINMLRDEVTGTRTPVEGWIANGAKNFFPDTIRKAIYCTAWDGDIVLVGTQDGTWSNLSDLTTSLLNINTASKEELMTLPSIGDAKSQSIIDYRSTNPIADFEELDDVPGIGPATIARIRAHVRFE